MIFERIIKSYPQILSPTPAHWRVGVGAGMRSIYHPIGGELLEQTEQRRLFSGVLGEVTLVLVEGSVDSLRR